MPTFYGERVNVRPNCDAESVGLQITNCTTIDYCNNLADEGYPIPSLKITVDNTGSNWKVRAQFSGLETWLDGLGASGYTYDHNLFDNDTEDVLAPTWNMGGGAGDNDAQKNGISLSVLNVRYEGGVTFDINFGGDNHNVSLFWTKVVAQPVTTDVWDYEDPSICTDNDIEVYVTIDADDFVVGSILTDVAEWYKLPTGWRVIESLPDTLQFTQGESIPFRRTITTSCSNELTVEKTLTVGEGPDPCSTTELS